jgi:hypothetical protein
VTDELKVYYLVKWNNTFYDGSTWESEEDVEKVCHSPELPVLFMIYIN